MEKLSLQFYDHKCVRNAYRPLAARINVLPYISLQYAVNNEETFS